MGASLGILAIRLTHYQSVRLANNLRQARETLEITQAEAARRCGISRSSWMYYELGRRWPSNEELLDIIARAVETTASQLLRHNRG